MKTHHSQLKRLPSHSFSENRAVPAFPQDPNQKLLRIASADILHEHREVEIEHHGMVYRLRCTALGKLILTK